MAAVAARRTRDAMVFCVCADIRLRLRLRLLVPPRSSHILDSWFSLNPLNFTSNPRIRVGSLYSGTLGSCVLDGSPMSFFPVNQVRLTNVAIVRLKKNGKRFEVRAHPRPPHPRARLGAPCLRLLCPRAGRGVQEQGHELAQPHRDRHRRSAPDRAGVLERVQGACAHATTRQSPRPCARVHSRRPAARRRRVLSPRARTCGKPSAQMTT